MLEFVMLFPFIVAILYAAGYYSVLFSWQYRMQSVVDSAVASGMYLDRSRIPESQLGATVVERSQATLNHLRQALPPNLNDALTTESNCRPDSVTDQNIVVVLCEFELSKVAIEGLLPSLSFGFLGQFPPAPDNGIHASAQVAF